MSKLVRRGIKRVKKEVINPEKRALEGLIRRGGGAGKSRRPMKQGGRKRRSS